MSDSSNAIRELAGLRQEINHHLKRYLASPEAQLAGIVSRYGEQAYQMMAEFSRRPGKRIRGALVIVGYQMFGGQHRAAALEAGVAIELLQDYLLIIDDVMDRSLRRRGLPTMHEQYKTLIEKEFSLQNPEHLSDMLAINMALILQHMAAGLLANVAEAPERVVMASRLLHKNVMATGYGQIDDLFNNAGAVTDETAIKHTYLLKSGYYTFVNPLQTGAVLAGADEADVAVFRSFGLHAGLAFQLSDDLIGMFGDEQTSGKSPLDDLREGKMTLLMHHALTHANKSEMSTLKAALGNKEVTVAQHRQVQMLLDSLGSHHYVQEQARQEAVKAHALLDEHAAWHKPSVAFLKGLLAYVVEREA